MPQKVHGTTKEKMIIWAMIVFLFAIVGGGIGSCGLYLAYSGKHGITQTGRDIQEHINNKLKHDTNEAMKKRFLVGMITGGGVGVVYLGLRQVTKPKD